MPKFQGGGGVTPIRAMPRFKLLFLCVCSLTDAISGLSCHETEGLKSLPVTLHPEDRGQGLREDKLMPAVRADSSHFTEVGFLPSLLPAPTNSWTPHISHTTPVCPQVRYFLPPRLQRSFGVELRILSQNHKGR